MTHTYQILLEFLAEDFDLVFGKGCVDALMTRPRDPKLTQLCEYAEFICLWDDSRDEQEDDITIRAIDLGITLTHAEMELLLNLYAKDKK